MTRKNPIKGPRGGHARPGSSSSVGRRWTRSASHASALVPHRLARSLEKTGSSVSLGVQLIYKGMGSEDSLVADDVNETVDVAENRCSGKNKGKVPKRVHKAEREKLKREQLNDLFLDLGNVLELTQPNNGKAFILCEATRTLKELFSQIDRLKKENVSLVSESNYVTIERNELEEENSVLESEVAKLQTELNARVAQSKPDLNVPPPEFQQPELAPHFPGESLGLPAVDAALQQAPAVFVVPLHPDLHQPQSVPSLPVSKPHARYPTASDSWPSQILGDCLTGGKEVQFNGGNNGGK